MPLHDMAALQWDDLLPPFEMFGYRFKLTYQSETRAYVLNFAAPPDDEGGADPAEKPHQRRPRIRKPAGASDKRVAAAMGELVRALERLGAGWRASIEGFVRLFLHSMALTTRAARNYAGVLCDMLSRWAWRMRRMFSPPSSTPASGPRGREAVLEPRLLGQNTGIAMLIYTLVWNDEPIDWSADLFGEPESERS